MIRESGRWSSAVLAMFLLLFGFGCAKSGTTSCNSNADCGSNASCVDGVCKKTTSKVCVSNSDCAKHEYCDSNVCRARSCVEAAQCGDPSLTCVSPGVCAPKDPNACDCAPTSACTATDPLCQGQKCDCKPTSLCTATDPSCKTVCDCQPTSACTATDPKCQPQCDCLPTSSCTATSPSCQTVCDCKPTSSCTATTPSCQTVCDCQPTSACTATTPSCQTVCDCQPTSSCTETDAKCTGPCNSDADCPRSSEYCDLTTSVCKKGCKNNTGCPGTEVCDMATHKCSGANLPCTLTADCKNNKVCSPIEDTDNPGTLVLRCKDPVAVGGSGEACTSNTECRTGACGANKLCFWACTKPEDCGASGWTCADTEVTVNGIKLAVKSCKSQPISGACVYDTDCPNAGDVCSLTVAQDGNSLVSACRTPVGTIEGGDPCAKDADCRSGVCLNTGVCFKHCATGSDCKGTNQLCEEMTFTFGTADAPKEQKVKGCNTQTQYCKSDADCTSNPNLSCHPSVANDGDNFLSPQCLLKVGDGIAGAACTTDADCRSGYCFTTAKLCYGICNSNTDCASGTKCYENMITFTFDQGTTVTTDDKYDSTSACVPDRGSWKLCTRDADCTSTEWCSPQPTKDSTKWEGRCAKRTGSIGPGGDCTADADCRSNFCIPPSQGVPPSSLNPGICFGMCSTSNDCVSIFSTCSSVDLTTHDRGTENDESDDLKAPLKVCL